jgi:hypothetical protein
MDAGDLMSELHSPERQQVLRDVEAIKKRQRSLDDLAANIESARRQLIGCREKVAELGRDGFRTPAIHGVAVEYVKDAQRTLALLANVIQSSGGRP